MSKQQGSEEREERGTKKWLSPMVPSINTISGKMSSGEAVRVFPKIENSCLKTENQSVKGLFTENPVIPLTADKGKKKPVRMSNNAEPFSVYINLVYI